MNQNLPSTKLAFTESEGFFDDISDEEWEMMRKKFRSMYPNTNRPTVNLKGTNWFQRNYEPDFACRHEQRVGRQGDGGKWVCDPFRISKQEKCLVYSVGSNGAASFEIGVHAAIGRQCEIHTFDFGDYAETVTEQDEGVHYHRWGIDSTSYTTGKGEVFKNLKDTVKELGHEGRVIDIFKIDCEGCELTSFSSWFDAKVTLRQILVEVHAFKNEVKLPQTVDLFQRFYREGYVITHKEPNMASNMCVEYVFLKLSPDFLNE